MHHIGFRLSDNPDPEERLEEAALWKAMYDHYGPDRISPLLSGDAAPANWVLFGRQRGRFQTGQEPVSDDLPYWDDPAFLAHCGRDFLVIDYEGLPAAVEALHRDGKAAFLKSTRLKHWKATVPVGSSVWDVLGDMAYSFMDGGPHVMVQEAVGMAYERRYFVIGRKVVESSPVMNALTPIDCPVPYGACYRTPTSPKMEILPSVRDRQDCLVETMAAEMLPEHAVVDVAMVGGWDGRPVVIEMNPMVLGQAGLFASSVRELAAASEVLLQGFVPNPRPTFALPADEEDFVDEDAAPWSGVGPAG
jgi:hypothetical protein